MSSIVVVAEPEEIKLIPLAFKGLPILVTGVGENAANTIECVDAELVHKIINIGYCGAPNGVEIGKMCKIGSDDGEYECISARKFIESAAELPNKFKEADGFVVDMEFESLQKWCDRNDVELEAYKIVSDNFDYEQYKKQVKE